MIASREVSRRSTNDYVGLIMSDQTWRVAHLYRDTAGWKEESDEFLRVLRSGDSTIANAGGVRFRDYLNLDLRDPETGRKVPSFFVLVTAEGRTQHHNPWDDIVDHIVGDIYYWGDAKYSNRGKRCTDFLGNSRIEAANNLRLTGELGKVPPFLHFTKPSVGKVRFNGLCSLVDVQHPGLRITATQSRICDYCCPS